MAAALPCVEKVFRASIYGINVTSFTANRVAAVPNVEKVTMDQGTVACWEEQQKSIAVPKGPAIVFFKLNFP